MKKLITVLSMPLFLAAASVQADDAPTMAPAAEQITEPTPASADALTLSALSATPDALAQLAAAIEQAPTTDLASVIAVLKDDSKTAGLGLQGEPANDSELNSLIEAVRQAKPSDDQLPVQP